MTSETSAPVTIRAKSRPGDRIFSGLALGAGLTILVVLAAVTVFLIVESFPALVSAYFSFMASEEGQQIAAEQAGSAPISEDLRTKITASLDMIG